MELKKNKKKDKHQKVPYHIFQLLVDEYYNNISDF